MGERYRPDPPALKHGAFSAMRLLPGEDAGAFEKLRSDLIAELLPAGRLEESIVETIAHLVWRQQNLKIYRLAAKSGATRTPIPAQGGHQSGDCGQQVMAA